MLPDSTTEVPLHAGMPILRLQDYRSDRRNPRRHHQHRHGDQRRRAGRCRGCGPQHRQHGNGGTTHGAQLSERCQRDECQGHRTLAGHYRRKRHSAHERSDDGTQQLGRGAVCHPPRNGQTLQLYACERSEDSKPRQQEPLCPAQSRSRPTWKATASEVR